MTRRGAAALSLMASGGTLAFEALRHISADGVAVAFAGILAGAGVLLTRPSIVGQTLARGAAWITFFPMALATGAQLLNHEVPGIPETALALTSGAALFLARPMLHTKAAKAAFDPHRFRRIFLAGSTATASAAFLTGGIALEMARMGQSYAGAFGFVLLTLALLTTAIGVVRMRAWGILLGAATSLALLGAAAVTGGVGGEFLALLAAPMLALHLAPILLARWLPSSPKAIAAENVAYRVAESPSRVRIQLDEDLLDADGEQLPQEGCKVHV